MGWIVVRDALTMGPYAGADSVTPHTRPPADDDGDHMLVRTVECIEGRVEVELDLRAGVRLRPDARRVDDGRGRQPRRRRDRRRADVPPPVRSRARDRGQPRPRPARPPGGRARVLLHYLGRGARRPADVEEAEERMAATTRFWRGWLGRARIPDHRWRDPVQRSALTIKGLTYMPTGATVAALTTSLPGDAGRRAQLGLPLHVDARHDVHAAGAALAQPRLGGRRVHAVRRRPRAERGRGAADHVRHRRSPRPDGVDPRPPLGLRGRAARADRQRRVRPAPERRLRRGARLDPAPHPQERAAAAAALADRRDAGRVRHDRSGASPTRGSGRPAGRRSSTCRRS